MSSYTEKKLLDLAHQWLKNLKDNTKISYKEISNIIGYTPEGTSKAIKNKTFSFNQIKAIALELDKTEDLSEFFKINNAPGLTEPAAIYSKKEHIKKLALDVHENIEELMKIPAFNIIIEEKVAKRLAQLSADKEAFKAFLNN